MSNSGSERDEELGLPPPPEGDGDSLSADDADFPEEAEVVNDDNDDSQLYDIDKVKAMGRRVSMKYDGMVTGLKAHGMLDPDDAFDEQGNFIGAARQVGDTDDPHHVKYEKPTKEMIHNFIIKKHIRNKKNGHKLSMCAKVSPQLFSCLYCGCGGKKSANESLIELGPGIPSYFYFLKLYAFLFLIFGALTIPTMYLNYVVGNELAFFMTLSVGNLLQSEDFVEVENVFNVSVYGNDFALNRTGVSFLIVATDVIIILIFLSVAEYSVRFFHKEQYKWERQYPTLENFSIEVSNLPPNITYIEIRKYFKEFVALRLYEDENVDRQIINDIQLVTTTKDKLSYAIKVADLARTAEHKEAKYALAEEKAEKGKISTARLRIILLDYQNSVNRLQKFIESKDILSGEKKIVVVKVFITFNSLKIRNKVIEEFNRKGSCKCCGKIEELELNGRPLKVSAAVSPALVKWENMDYKSSHRFFRGCLSNLLILLVLLISTATVFAATKVEQLNFFLSEEQQGFIQDLVCDDFIDEIAQFSGENTVTSTLLVDSGCDNEIELTLLNETCTQAFTCFCDINDNQADGQAIFANPVCQELLAINSILSFGTGILIALFNFILEVVISNTVRFERDHDRDSEERKLFIRLFISTYINTALVKLVTDLSFEELFQIEFDDTNAFLIDGDFSDFTADWYAQVGVDIVIIGFSNIFGPHILSVVQYISFHISQSCFKPISVQDIKKRHLGPEFLLPLKYAQAAAIIFFTLTYSSGIPLLYPICAVALIVTYWVDKFMLLKLHRSPPLYTNQMVLWICRVLRWGVLIHALVGVFMLSEPNLFPLSAEGLDVLDVLDENNDFVNIQNLTGGDEILTRVTGTPVIFLTVVFVLLLIYQILSQFEFMFKLLVKFIGCIITGIIMLFFFLLRLITCQVCKKKEEEQKYTWTQEMGLLASLRKERDEYVLDRTRLVGLPSYNILANPLYSRRLKLKGDRSFNSILADQEVKLHSTEEVLPLLDHGEDRAHIDNIVQRQNTTKGFFKRLRQTTLSTV